MAVEDDVRDDGAQDRPAGAPVEQPGGEPPVLSGPAPVIDLGEDAVPVLPAKPLGPRRLARLQRELAERSRELEETGAGSADPGLLDKQRRFAELAAQAAAAQPGAAQPGPVGSDADPAPVVAEAPELVEPAEPSAVVPGGPPEPTEQITVVFPGGDGSGGPEGHASHDPVHVDPALFSNRLAPEELAALTHIEIIAPGDTGQQGSHAHTAAGQITAAPGTAGEHEDPGDAAEPPPAPPGLPADTTPAWAEDEPPADPVPAGAAGGLELLEPREYRRRAGTAWWVLLLPAVLAALAVVLVLLVP